ncbi:hypothetical protein DdX_08304 [Ditylenchus destructor]|uniref:Uncharacterized protein n=1 Tax=Ditylenchus destructor TaxID=166010 RepID=A0AAD4N487_9BILA|nr:hypothetical protein DdX_08304 [Ditylenchus destructor]
MYSIADIVKLNNGSVSGSDEKSKTDTPAGRTIKTKLIHPKCNLPKIALKHVNSPEEQKPLVNHKCSTEINGSKNNILKEAAHKSFTNERKSCQQKSIEPGTSDENESDIEYEVEEVEVGPRPPPMYILPKWVKIPVEVHVEKLHDVSKIIALDREGAYVMKESPFTEPRCRKSGKRKTTNRSVNRQDVIQKRRFERIVGGFTNLQQTQQPALEVLGDDIVKNICLKIDVGTNAMPNVAESSQCNTTLFAPLQHESAVVLLTSRLTENATATFRCFTSRSRKKIYSKSVSDTEEESNRRVAEIVIAIKSQARKRELAAAKPEKRRKRGHRDDVKLQTPAKKWPKNRPASVHSWSTLESSEQLNEPTQNLESTPNVKHMESNETYQMPNVAESLQCNTTLFAPLQHESAVVLLTSRLTENATATFRCFTSRSRKQIYSKSGSDAEEESNRRVAEIVTAIKSQARERELAAAKQEKQRKRGHSADANLLNHAKCSPRIASVQILETDLNLQIMEPNVSAETSNNNDMVNMSIGTTVDDTMESDIRQLKPVPISPPRESALSNPATDECDTADEREAIQNTIGAVREENNTNAITNGVERTPVVKEEPLSEDDYFEDEEDYEEGEWEFVTDDEDETVDIKHNISRTCGTVSLVDACSQTDDLQPAQEDPGSVSAPVAILDSSQNVSHQRKSGTAENVHVLSDTDYHSLESISALNGTRMDSSMDPSSSHRVVESTAILSKSREMLQCAVDMIELTQSLKSHLACLS